MDRARAGRGRLRDDDQRGVRRWLSRGRPGVRAARSARRPRRSFAQIHGAGGIASLAHPGLLRRDEWIAGLAAAGLDALEAYHTNHDDATTTARYLRDRASGSASRVTGGSDYHARRRRTARGASGQRRRCPQRGLRSTLLRLASASAAARPLRAPSPPRRTAPRSRRTRRAARPARAGDPATSAAVPSARWRVVNVS